MINAEEIVAKDAHNDKTSVSTTFVPYCSYRGTQREDSSKPLKRSIVKGIIFSS